MFRAVIKITITTVLSKFDLIYAIITLATCSAKEVVMAIKIYSLIKNKNQDKVEEYKLTLEGN